MAYKATDEGITGIEIKTEIDKDLRFVEIVIFFFVYLPPTTHVKLVIPFLSFCCRKKYEKKKITNAQNIEATCVAQRRSVQRNEHARIYKETHQQHR